MSRKKESALCPFLVSSLPQIHSLAKMRGTQIATEKTGSGLAGKADSRHVRKQARQDADGGMIHKQYTKDQRIGEQHSQSFSILDNNRRVPHGHARWDYEISWPKYLPRIIYHHSLRTETHEELFSASLPPSRAMDFHD